MKKPRVIKIGCHKYKVRYCKEVYIKNEAGNKEELLGYCDIDNFTILIKSGICESMLKEVLIHECIHAIDQVYGLGLSEKAVNMLGIEVVKLIMGNKLDLLK